MNPENPSAQCPAMNTGVWHAPAQCKLSARHTGSHETEVAVSAEWGQNVGERRLIGWNARGHGTRNTIIDANASLFFTDADRDRLRADGLTDEQIDGEQRALLDSYVEKPEYRKPTDSRSLRKQQRHRNRVATSKGDPVTAASTAQHVVTHRSVPLKDLWLEHPLWTNPREFTGLEADKIEDLGTSIKTEGLKDPPTVKRILVKGVVVNLVTDGQRRIVSAREVLPKDTMIPVVDHDDKPPVEMTPELADELTLAALTSLKREGLSSYELSNVASKMKDRGKTLDYIGKAISRDPSWVSKMLTARKSATPKLMTQWRKGEITDEQFKELAAVKDPEKQSEAVKEVVETRKSGDKAEARLRTKEIAERAKADGKPAAKNEPKITITPKGKDEPPAVRGPQVDMFKQPIADGDEPVKPKMRARAVLDDLLAMADKRPPTSDYVKGVIDTVKFVCGIIEADQLSKAWQQYVNRVEGKPAAKPAKAKPAKAAKAAKPAKAKPAKKAKPSKRVHGAKRK